jgi:hypothetical protein
MTRDQFLSRQRNGGKPYYIDGWYEITDSFSTPDGFFKLWNWAKEQEWFGDFWYNEDVLTHEDIVLFINPDCFASVIAEYLGFKEE